MVLGVRPAGAWATFLCTALFTSAACAADRLTLADAYRLALEYVERVAIADTEVARTRLGAYRALSTAAPSVNFTGTYTREKEELEFTSVAPSQPLPGVAPGTNVILPGQVVRGGLRVDQTVLNLQLIPLWRAAQREIEASKEARTLAVQETAFAVAQAYHDVLRADAQGEVAEETVRLAAAEERRARVRYDVGELVKTDLLRASVALAQARQLATAATNAKRLTRDVLSRLVGREVTEVIVPPSPSLPVADIGAGVEMALTRRPDLRQQERLLAATKEERRRRQFALLPSVGAQWDYKNTSVETFAERNNFWTFVLGLRVPIIDRGGGAWVDLREQEYRLEVARLAYEGLRRDIRLEVQRAWLDADTLAANLHPAEEETRLADETYMLVSKQYDAGAATSLEVATALTDRQRARARFINTQSDRDVAVLAVRRATGVLASDVEGFVPAVEVTK
ncbi:MAG TPA: TolC family protein [Candidatus Limnocylindria bacterium]|nr:TolC family protein [Candidatus Limnocylindria bacterium]